MEVVNTTPFQFAPHVGRISFPGHSLTVIVKGTFDLVPARPAVPAGEQLFPTGDEYFEDDEELEGSCRYDADAAFFKPRCDLLFAGKCHVPEGRPMSHCNVTFQVGSQSKTLDIFGDRHWKPSLLGFTATDPQPFTEMSLRFENSFGGQGFKKNPVGKGYRSTKTETGDKVQLLPNIENPKNPVSSPQSCPDPAGFGPVGRTWQQRVSKLGTYDDTWFAERWPWFPTDFDWTYFNAASPDMQVEGYLNGAEELYFENLHPIHSQYHSSLPNLRVRCFLNELMESNSQEIQFREIQMNLDTLWVDMTAEKLVLVWRGVAEVKSEEFDEVQHCFIISEALNEQQKSLEECHQWFHKRLIELDEEWNPPPPESEREAATIQPKVDDEEKVAREAKEEKEEDEKFDIIELQMREQVIAAGIDPDNLPPPDPKDRELLQKKLREDGIDLDKEEKEFEQSESVQPAEEPAPATREEIANRIDRKECFADEDLAGVDLSGFEMKGIDFQGAILVSANLSGCNLSGANLSRANLSQANLKGAIFSSATFQDADLHETDLAGADLTSAILNNATFENATLKNAVLDNVSAMDTTFVESILTGVLARNGNFSGADFTRSKLNGANFQDSNLFEATLKEAVGIGVNMSGANLTELRASDGCDFSEGNFRGAVGPESIWENATLRNADFSFSQMQTADFSSACLENANLTAADMSFARFTKADLRYAILAEMNLFKGNMERADLAGADLTGANMYEVEFLGAIKDEAKLTRTNLKMTKLAKR